jgi:hypothetical protein
LAGPFISGRHLPERKMKLKKFAVFALCLGTAALQAQETNEVEQLKHQLQQIQENFDRVVQEQRQQIEALTRQVNDLVKQQTAAAEKTSAPPASAATPTEPATTSAPLSKPWSPGDPVRVGDGGTYMDISMVATFAAGASTAKDIEGGTQLGGHDPNQNGFTVQGAEINLQGAVDPYFRGNANIVFQLDSGGKSFVELEEAWLETVSLPWNLQVRAGQFLTDFGRINTQHPHTWGFVDTPLVSGRLLGADGLCNPGARISWLVPTPFYSELFFAVQDSQGGTAHSFRSDHGGGDFLGRIDEAGRVKTFTDMLLSARYAASFDLTDNQTLLAGASAAFGPNGSGNNTDTQIYGADVYWKWKSPSAHGGFPFVSWQTEAMLRRYEAAASTTADLNGDGVPDFVPRETLIDWGFYSQLLWGFKKGWVAGLRGDCVDRTQRAAYEVVYGDDPERLGRWRISPNLTWYPSEFSKIRLQYNYDDREQIGVDHSVWLQFEFLLGAHAAHKF